MSRFYELRDMLGVGDSPWWTWALSGISVGWCARSVWRWLRGVR